MKLAVLWAALWLPAPAPTCSQPRTGPGAAVETEETAAARSQATRLKEHPEARLRLARRLLELDLFGRPASAADRADRLDEAAEWIRNNPEDARRLAAGFAGDDRDGTRAFETSLTRRVRRHFELNPKSNQGLLGALTAAGSRSKDILDLADRLAEEERREAMRNVFEGRSGGEPRTLTAREDSRRAPDAGTFDDSIIRPGIYDRLSAANPAGYSPQVLALQSSLNAQRVPGSPALAETGRLDHATLLHPAHALSYDLRRLQSQWRLQKAWASPEGSGGNGTFHPERPARPGRLPGNPGAGREPSQRFQTRRRALERAARAIEELRASAEPARDPSKITQGMLQTLGLKQREAARWISVASLEADRQNLELLRDFWSPELIRRIEAAPAPEAARRAYMHQGRLLRERLSRILGADARALAELRLPDPRTAAEKARPILESVQPLRKDLPEHIQLFSSLPALLASRTETRPGRRSLLRRWALRLAPDGSCARRRRREWEGNASLLEAFGRAASGDYAGARRALPSPSTSGLARE